MGSIVIDGSALTAALVGRLDADIKSQGQSTPRLVVDCSKVQELTPQGLSALLELGGRLSGVWQVALAALPRSFVREAVEVGLSERFAIYATVEAAQRALSERES